MNSLITLLQKEKATLESQLKDCPLLKKQLEDNQAKFKSLRAIDPKKISPDELKEFIKLEMAIITDRREIQYISSANLDKTRRIEEIDLLLGSSQKLEESQTRLSELDSELNALERKANELADGIAKLEVIKTGSIERLEAFTNATSAALLQSVGLSTADAVAPKQNEVLKVQHEIESATAAIESAQKMNAEHAEHIHEVKRDRNNVIDIIAHATCDLRALEHAHALGEYLAVLARLRSAERAIHQWPVRIDHESLALEMIREVEGF